MKWQKDFSFVFVWIFILLLPVACAQQNVKSPLEEKLIVQYVVKIIEEFHYSNPKLNDKLSEMIFESYLKRLDPNRYFLLEEDIKKWNLYKDVLDDMLARGNVQFAYIVFEKYLERIKERIDYIHKLLQENISFEEDEFLALDRKNLPWAKSKEELDEIWRKEIKNQLLQNKLSEILEQEKAKDPKNKEDNEQKDIEKVSKEDIKDRVAKRYDRFYRFLKEHDNYDILEYFLNSFTETFDPHSNYMNWRAVEDFDITLKLSLQGIGALLTSEDGYPKVERIVPGGPAEKQGQLKAGYRIIAVGQGEEAPENVLDMPLNKVVRKIRGKKGTQVTLVVIKDLQAVPFKIVITRDDIKLKEREAKGEVKEVFDGSKKVKLGILFIPSFYRDFEGLQSHEEGAKSTVQDVKAILDDMVKKDKIEGLVIDLRSNPGGSLEEAIDLAGLFIPSGPVVQIRSMQDRYVREDNDNGFFYDVPLVVMVNTFSASASEIFAGVIQDYNRGIIVGQNTYGKGTVQNLLDLKRLTPLKNLKPGALKYTTGKFYRVTGASTQQKGVAPDIAYPAFSTAEEYGESTLKNVMPWDEIESLSFKKTEHDARQYLDYLSKNHTKRLENNKLFQELNEYINWWKERKNRKTLSLNLQKRLALSKEDEQWSRRIEKILEDNKHSEQDLVGSEEKKSDSKDIYLEETLQILKDMLSQIEKQS